MAVHICRFNVVSRMQGKSAVAAAAYRAGEKLKSEYDGLTYDYTKKHWVEDKEIILPETAPCEYKDRQTLWNAVESAEKRRDSSLARDILLALPNEMTRDQQLEIVREFVMKNFVEYGYAVDICIHNPPVSDIMGRKLDKDGRFTNKIEEMTFRNPHAHVLATMRPFDEDGNFQYKALNVYICRRGEEEREFTAEEFKEAKKEGWYKQYCYQKEGKKVWLSKEEGEGQGLTRIKRKPKELLYGRRNPVIAMFENPDHITKLRFDWQDIVNKKYEEIGLDERIYARTIDNPEREYELPLVNRSSASYKMDYYADELVKRGKSKDEVEYSEQGLIHKEIKEHNLIVQSIRRVMEDLNNKADSIIKEIAAKLEELRIKWIINRYNRTRNEKILSGLRKRVDELGASVDKYYSVCLNIQEAATNSEKKLKDYKRQLDECPSYNLEKKRNLKTLIAEEKRKETVRNEYLVNIRTKLGFSSEEDYLYKRSELLKKRDILKEYEQTIALADANADIIKKEYAEEKQKVPESYENSLKKERKARRKEYDRLAFTELAKYHKEDVDSRLYNSLSSELDKDVIDSDIPKKKEAKTKNKVKTR